MSESNVESEERGNLSEIWTALKSPMWRVLDENGVNMAYAKMRQDKSGQWLYVDDMDGYSYLSDADVSRLIRVPESEHIPRGYDVAGNVIEL